MPFVRHFCDVNHQNTGGGRGKAVIFITAKSGATRGHNGVVESASQTVVIPVIVEVASALAAVAYCFDATPIILGINEYFSLSPNYNV